MKHYIGAFAVEFDLNHLDPIEAIDLRAELPTFGLLIADDNEVLEYFIDEIDYISSSLQKESGYKVTSCMHKYLGSEVVLGTDLDFIMKILVEVINNHAEEK